MDLVFIQEVDMSEVSDSAVGKIYALALNISNLGQRIRDMYDVVTDTSWLVPLDIIDNATYSARSQPTIDKVVNEILSNVESTVSVELGEYMVSDVAQTALNKHLKHFRAPLAELIKEKISGNPGFDFHTESPNALISFGEAKFSAVKNSHGKALSQIGKFIIAKKDIQELSDLRKFLTAAAVQNAVSGKKSFCAAFSIVSENIDEIMSNAINSELIHPLLCFESVYLVGVKINV